MTLRISAAAWDAIVADCLERRPIEACGIVSAKGLVIPLPNAARSASFYAFDPEDQLAVWQGLDTGGDRVEVVYHSHTMTAAVPSATDIRYAAYPEAHYLIVGLADPAGPEVRSWRIADGVATEEDVVMVLTTT